MSALNASPIPILAIENLVKRYGGHVVLDGVTLAVAPGEIRGLIGPNGAGKTTLFNVVNGMQAADSGKVLFDGADITSLPLERVAKLGVGRTFQVARTFSEMTLLDNLLVPCVAHGISNKAGIARAREMLETAQLDRLRHMPAVEISGGQKKLLEFIRVMMVRPKLVLLDEPFNGINPALIELLIRLIKNANEDHGTSFALISHEMPHVSELCHSVTVLTAGKTLMTGTSDEVKNNTQVIDAYLGR